MHPYDTDPRSSPEQVFSRVYNQNFTWIQWESSQGLHWRPVVPTQPQKPVLKTSFLTFVNLHGQTTRLGNKASDKSFRIPSSVEFHYTHTRDLNSAGTMGWRNEWYVERCLTVAGMQHRSLYVIHELCTYFLLSFCPREPWENLI